MILEDEVQPKKAKVTNTSNTKYICQLCNNSNAFKAETEVAVKNHLKDVHALDFEKQKSMMLVFPLFLCRTTCGNCKQDNESTLFVHTHCHECGQNICSACVQAHQTWPILQNHILTPLPK